MGFPDFFLRVYFTLALLSTPQIGAEHALSPVFEEQTQKDNQAPHSAACEKCAMYFQLGSTLCIGDSDFSLPGIG